MSPRYKKGTGKRNTVKWRRAKGVRHRKKGVTQPTEAWVSVSTPAPLLKGEPAGVSCPSARSEWVVEEAARAAAPQKVLFSDQDTEESATGLRRSERVAVAAVLPAASPDVPPARSPVVVVQNCMEGCQLSTPGKARATPRKSVGVASPRKSVHVSSAASTRSSTARAKQAAPDAVEVKDSDAQKKLADICVFLSDKSSVNPDPEVKALQGRAARKLFAGADLQPRTRLAYFYYIPYVITEALVIRPHDSGVDRERDQKGVEFLHDVDWATNAWYAADHMENANAELVPGTVDGIPAVILVAKTFIAKGSEIGHRYSFPPGMGVPEDWLQFGEVSASGFPDEVKLPC